MIFGMGGAEVIELLRRNKFPPEFFTANLVNFMLTLSSFGGWMCVVF